MQRSGRVLVGVARGWVRALLLLYPRVFRRRFAADMLNDFDERLEERAAHGMAPVLLLLAQTTVDVAVAALREWLHPSVPRDVPFPDDCHRLTRGHLMDHLKLDLRFALRSLARRPGFTAVAVTTLALGIGANTAIFSVVNGVLLRSLPYLEPDRLVMVWQHDLDDPSDDGSMSGPDMDDVRKLDAVIAIEGISTTSRTLTGSGTPELVETARVTGGLLAAFGLRPVLGRDLTHEDDLRGAARVVVVGYDFWQTRLGGRADVIGTTLELSEESHEIVGVAPAGFRFPVGGSFDREGVELWTGHRRNRESCGRGCHIFRALAQLAPGVSVDRASAELTALSARLSDAYPDDNFGTRFRFEPLDDFMVGDVRRSLKGEPEPTVYMPHAQYGPRYMIVHLRGRPGAPNLLAAAREQVHTLDPDLPLQSPETVHEALRQDAAPTRFFLMLVALFAGLSVVLAAVGLYGVASYLVSQRAREIGIRLALGASRMSITRLVLRHAVWPALLGVSGGLLASIATTRVMRSLLFEVEPTDPLVFGAVSVLLLAVATAASLVPARRAMRVNPTEVLRVE